MAALGFDFGFALIMALAAVYVAVNGRRHERAARYWGAVAAGFVLLACGALVGVWNAWMHSTGQGLADRGDLIVLAKGGGFIGGALLLSIGLFRWMSDTRDELESGTAAFERKIATRIADMERVTAELREHAERYDHFSDLAHDRYWESDEHHRTIFISTREGDEKQWPREFWFGKPRWEAKGVHFDPDVLRDYLAKLDRREPFADVPFSVVDGFGETHYYRVGGTPAFRDDGRFKGYRGTARRFDAEVEAERALAETERKFRDIYHRTPTMMHSTDRNGRVVEVSNFWLEALGYRRQEVIGRSILEFLTEESRDRATTTDLPKFLQVGFCRDVPYQIVKKDGTTVEISLSAVGVEDPAGNLVHSVTVMTDVTERKRAEARAQRAWERLHDAVESIDHGFCLWDKDDRLVLANSRYYDLFPEGCNIAKPGMTFEEILRPLIKSGFLSLDPGEADDFIRARVAEHQRCERNNERQLPDGRWVRLSEYRTRHGEIAAIRSDITDIKKREAELLKSRARFRDFAAASVDRFWETDENDVVTYISPPTGRLYLPSEQICGKKIWTEDRPKTWNSKWEDVEIAMAERRPFREFRSSEIQSNGNILHAKMSGAPWYDEQGAFKGYRGGVTDVTTEVEAVERAADVQARFMTAIEGISDGLVLWDAQDRFVTCNSHFRKNAPDCVAGALVPGTTYIEYLRCRAGAGEVVDALGREDEWVAEHLANRRMPIHETFARGRWFRVRCQRLNDGSTIEFHSDVSDIKAREAELENAKAGAESASHAKSEFLSSVSHEMRTPMNAILGFGQLLADGKVSNEKVRKRYVQQILKGGGHLLQLIDEMLDLAKIEAGTISVSPEPVPSAAVIEECLSMVDERARISRIVLENLDADAALPDLWIDRVRFRQILLNLLSNAVKYNRIGGKVALSRRVTEDGMMRISVGDTGQGIAERRQGDLFKPFNRLGRESGDVEGTGIGLAITRSLVELLGGNIGFESEEGIGSTFWVDLPLANPGSVSRFRHATSPMNLLPKERIGGATRTVLYVEDNPSNVALMTEIVGQFPNTELLSARSAEDAIETAADRRPDLILMDVNLPGIDGFEALRRLKADIRTRGIPVVAVSAAAMPSDVEKGLNAGFVKYLTKPVDLAEVYEVLSECWSVDS
jgi:PAS domain S-box-containing protein